ncbi:hypothetical protein BN132_3650 [Cronobacter turicensis 564]|nr:hypothetical protein BN132_3650 [Cronobacter turicensis 564]
MRDNVFVERHIERAAHARVVKRRFAGIKFIVIGGKQRRDINLVGYRFFQLGELVERHGAGDVDFARFIAIQIRRFGGDWQVSDFIDDRLFIVPVALITLGHDLFIHHPVGDFIRAAAHEMFRSRPFIAETLNRGFIDRHQRRVRQHRQERRGGLRQRHLDGIVIQRLHAQGARRLFAVSDVGGVFNVHVARKGGVRRDGFRIDQAPPAPDHILRRDWLAVRPGHALAQMKRPDGVVFVLPAFGETRLDSAIFTHRHQPFKNVADDVEFNVALHFMRVERGRLAAVVAHQFLFCRQLNACRHLRRIRRRACAGNDGSEKRKSQSLMIHFHCPRLVCCCDRSLTQIDARRVSRNGFTSYIRGGSESTPA